MVVYFSSGLWMTPSAIQKTVAKYGLRAHSLTELFCCSQQPGKASTGPGLWSRICGIPTGDVKLWTIGKHMQLHRSLQEDEQPERKDQVVWAWVSSPTLGELYLGQQ